MTNLRLGSLFKYGKLMQIKQIKLEIGLFLLVSIVTANSSWGAKPIINSLSPDNGMVGEKIRIFGSNFENIQGITFNGVLAPVFFATAQNQVEVTIPAGALSGPISIQNPSGIGISADSFTVYNPGPRPMSFTPESGLVGEVITIEGSHFSPSTRVVFNENVIATQMEIRTEGELRVVVPDGATSGPVTLFDNLGSNTSLVSFDVVVLNDLEFKWVTPEQSFSTGEVSLVEWEIKSLSNVRSTSVQLTLLLPNDSFILDSVESDRGQHTAAGRFYQISDFNVDEGEIFRGGIRFIPNTVGNPISFEGSVSLAERDPNQTNNSMVRVYNSIVRAPEIGVSMIEGNKVRLDWPAYPDDWQLYQRGGLQQLDFWELVTQQPFEENNRKVMIILPDQTDDDILIFRLVR